MPERDSRIPQEPQKEVIFRGNTAFVFPGQGAQKKGMGIDVFEESLSAKAVFKEADDALGFPISEMIFSGSEKELTETINAQPAITIVSIAYLGALRERLGDKMPIPDVVGGHSLGLYPAAIAAGSLDFGSGIRLVRERGRLMQEASEKQKGGMAAIIGLPQSVLEKICLETGVDVANINSDQQIVISGEANALALAMESASTMGAKRAQLLKVSGAWHSRLMKPAQEGLMEVVSDINFKDPKVPIIANSSGRFLVTAKDIKEELVKGVCEPVRWKDDVMFMAQAGLTHFLEFGPGTVLSGLIKQINRDFQTFSINSLEAVRNY